jgi:hypothetical protein
MNNQVEAPPLSAVDMPYTTSDAQGITSNVSEYPNVEPDGIKLDAVDSTPTCAQSCSLHVGDEHSSGRSSLATARHGTEPNPHDLGGSDVESTPPRSYFSSAELHVVTAVTIFAVPLALFTFYYLQQGLVLENPRLGQLFLTPSRTLTLVSVLTQSLAVGLPLLLNYLLDMIHLSSVRPNDSASCQGRLKATFLLGTSFFTHRQRYPSLPSVKYQSPLT